MNFAQSLGGLSIWILLWGSNLLRAQPDCTLDWTESDQSYLRIPIVQTGFYQISRASLLLAGVPVDQVDIDQIRLYRRGQELSLEVKKSKDGSFQSLGFYAEKNDGRHEAALYLKPEYLPHPFYSLYSDTAVHFLAWHHRPEPAQRIKDSQDSGSYQVIDHHLHEHLNMLTTDYVAGQFYPPESGYSNGSVRTEYDLGEGWTGPAIKQNIPYIWSIPLDQALFYSDSSIHLKLLLAGRSAGQHRTTLFVRLADGSARMLGIQQWSGYHTLVYDTSLSITDFFNAKELRLEIHSNLDKSVVSLSYALLRYPKKSIFSLGQGQHICHFEPGAKSWKIDKDPSWHFYDISHPTTPERISAKQEILSWKGTRVLAMSEPLNISFPKLVHFPSLPFQSVDYLILTHGSLRRPLEGKDAVQEYANYRQSANGGNFRVLMMNMDEVADRFQYGDRGPLGIRKLITSLPSLRYVFIIGKSIDPQTARKSTKRESLDQVPSAGWPGSDLPLTTALNGRGEFIPLIPVGRLNTDNPLHILDYMEKVKGIEGEPVTAAWRKRILHLSGGLSLAERSVFREYVDAFAGKLEASNLVPDISTISKQGEQASEQFGIHEPVNRGVALMTLFGHTGLNRSDIDIGLASDPRRLYQNHPFYPALLVNGCAIGNFYYSQPTLTNDWILAKGKGAVLAIAHTHNGLTAQLKHYTDSFYEVLADSSFRSKGFGDIQLEAIKRNMERYPHILDGITSTQMALQGDPAIKIFPATLPDYIWPPGHLRITSVSSSEASAGHDSLRLQINLSNQGIYRPDSLSINVSRYQEKQLIQVENLRTEAPRSKKLLDIIIPNRILSGGNEQWFLTIDPDHLLTESDKSNNSVSHTWYLPPAGAQPLWPGTNFTTGATEVTVMAQTANGFPDGLIKFEWDSDSSFTSPDYQQQLVSARDALASSRQILPINSTLYWRVSMAGEGNKSSPWRSISQQTPFSPSTPALPEGIALPTSGAIRQVMEGAPFSSIIVFRNLAPIEFTDSIKVSQTWQAGGKFSETIYTFPPPAPYAEAELTIQLPTLGKVGQNKLRIEFNSSRIAELSYHNNIWHHEFEVIPDLAPPVLQVRVDGRLVKNYEAIHPEAIFEFQIIDNHLTYPPTDTSALLVYLTRECYGCYAERLYLASAGWELSPSGTLKITTRPGLPLVAGTYLLQVYARDRSHNWAKPYEVKLKVLTPQPIHDYRVYPNPSKDWVVFEWTLEGEHPPPGWQVEVWDASGRCIIRHHGLPIIGLNRWLWLPRGLTAGSYFYRIQIIDPNINWGYTLSAGRLDYLP
ncbi:putative type IX secretion system sortase PorU2 [Dyadobacter tibetensis]|uniref:putative type IX secretion system sortase PorU2 n=1 Tax=Dyadobacter tibetensis TaxID=1211851 RepID=UPI0004709070|nr:C25 family cysteine peptidase [Dyadobacter tibetensis]